VTDKPVVLAVETSSRVGSVALALGPDLLEESWFSAPLQHSAELFPTIKRLLARYGRTPSEIAQIHLSAGPGSFTGLRIAVTMAKTMHLANQARIVTVDSLDVVAANLPETSRESPRQEKERRETTVPETIVALFDAKRGQFYAAIYQRVMPGRNQPQESLDQESGYRIPAPDNGTWRKTVPDCLMTAGEILKKLAGAGRIGLLGDGLLYHRDRFNADDVVVLPERYWSPHAANVHLLGHQKALAGRFADPLTLTPFYLRGPEVTLKRSP
jgi:tRNA threonylcarbamoyladenosine biosynthesis protein TsaB